MVKPVSEKPAEKNDSKYTGVRKRKWGKYVSEIRLPNSRERIWLGSYDTAEKAARAFDAALFCLRGKSAKFNFPENPPDIIGGCSLTPDEIQMAAARFAHSEPQTRMSDSSSSSLSEMNMEYYSPSPSVSGGPAQLDSDVTLGSVDPSDPTFFDIFSTQYDPDFGINYPGFDVLTNDFFVPAIPSVVDYEEENDNAFYSQGSFLWNF